MFEGSMELTYRENIFVERAQLMSVPPFSKITDNA